MEPTTLVRIFVASLAIAAYLGIGPLRRFLRAKRYTRGRKIADVRSLAKQRASPDSLMLGNIPLSPDVATNHFLLAATSGGAKTLLQRRLMAPVLKRIMPGSDSRCLILDAKNDIVAFLQKIEVTCPVALLGSNLSAESTPVASDGGTLATTAAVPTCYIASGHRGLLRWHGGASNSIDLTETGTKMWRGTAYVALNANDWMDYLTTTDPQVAAPSGIAAMGRFVNYNSPTPIPYQPGTTTESGGFSAYSVTNPLRQ